MWDPPGSGMEPETHALAGEFFITEPPGEPRGRFFFFFYVFIFIYLFGRTGS